MKIRSRWLGLTAAFILLTLTVRTDVAYGAVGIETDRKCSVTFDLDVAYQKKMDAPLQTPSSPPEGQVPAETVKGSRYEELTDEEKVGAIHLNLYRVASVNTSGKYQAGEAYADLQGSLSAVNDRTSAEEWEKLAAAAEKMAGNDTARPFEFHPGAEQAGRTLSGLETGLYLVTAQEVLTPEYIYRFTPYLVSLPGNDYYRTEDDGWLYDVTVGLKPGQENRYGDLEIVKMLDSYNATLGGASFVFQVEAEKDGIVFSDAVSVVFDHVGTRSVRIAEKIPAGALVTVTEIYHGSSYQAVSDPVQTQIIVADQTVQTAFSNEYDERLNVGTSVVNHFYQKDEGSVSRSAGRGGDAVWDWMQMTDSTEQTGGGPAHEEDLE